MFCYFYILLTDMAFVFQSQYGFSTLQGGLSYLGLGLGSLLGLFLFATFSDKYIAKQQALGRLTPEHRLAPIVIGSPLVSAGLLWYGWSAQRRLQWMMPIVGTAVWGFGFVAYIVPVLNYLIDSWKQYAASAISANVFLRSIVGALMPLVSRPLYNHLGLGWGNSLLAFVALATAPLPIVFMRYGRKLREKFPVQI